MSKNICRLDGNQIFLSVLRDDEEAVGLYAKWMSDETTCVFIEHAHSVVDITRMPGWGKRPFCHADGNCPERDRHIDWILSY